ncbi:RibD family protein [Nodosilinea sp. E11]|uniref:RibD family protein n=1 Tax=Nodosilinea sp. E11 TaxID=3037479 RepID=UPI0029350D45|nr:RibD family protein [Nodosilinea sp. E11]WOD40946.1 RibD family protein [Nodosilinea sp. E11]
MAIAPIPDSPLPHVTLVLAMSLDGKIADVQRGAARFSSAADLAHLEAQVAAADGVLFGAGTLRAYGTTLSVRQPDLLAERRQRGQADQPWQIVWSPSGHLDPSWRYFRQPVPRGLLTTAAGATDWNPEQFQRIWTIPEAKTQPWDWPWILAQFRAAGMGRLALLGGGGLVAELLRCHCIHEIFITVCPLLLGGATAPTPVEGAGFLTAVAPRLQLLSSQTVGGEVFLHYGVLPPPCQGR